MERLGHDDRKETGEQEEVEKRVYRGGMTGCEKSDDKLTLVI